jgi:hypothetical protein
LKTGENYIEVGYFQQNKVGEIVCGDCFMSKKLKEDGRILCVLSDGLGSGIKANILSTMTASMALNFSVMNEDIVPLATAIIKTLPKDTVKNISYSTFCICDIDFFGNVRIVEYQTPSFCFYSNAALSSARKEKILINREDMDNTYLLISEFTLQKGDRIVFFSDGVSQSGTGSKAMQLGWGNGVKEYISKMIVRTPAISAAELSHRVVAEAVKNDGFTAKDDTSCCAVYVRKPRNLLICTGPPYDMKNDTYLSKQLLEFHGTKIICGGTTAEIISRELNTPLEWDGDSADKSLPPISKMKGVDLITEGIVTLSKIECILTISGEERAKNDGLAELVIKYLLNNDKITFVVGTIINTAHQDPNPPIELEIRKNVVRKIKYLLETKYLKDVEIKYI